MMRTYKGLIFVISENMRNGTTKQKLNLAGHRNDFGGFVKTIVLICQKILIFDVGDDEQAFSARGNSQNTQQLTNGIPSFKYGFIPPCMHKAT